MSSNMSRRGFISGGAALTAAGAACAAALPGIAWADEVPAAVSPHAWENPPAPIDESQIIETVDCDVLVIGAGMSGLIAAQSAAEAGANTILIEKNESFAARGHDIAAIGAKAQIEAGIEVDLNQMRQDYVQITGYKTDISLFNIWAERSGEVLDYYVDFMAEQGIVGDARGANSDAALMSENPCTKEYPTPIQFGPYLTDEGEFSGHVFLRLVEGLALEQGLDIRYNTKGEQLIREGDGPVTGAFASTEDGYIRINAAKGVILATGGITQNKDMLKMWAPPAAKTEQVVFVPAEGNTGDGLCMGMWVGGAHQKTNQATMALPYGAAAGGTFSTRGFGVQWMTVNLNGQRYVREDALGPGLSHSTLPQPHSIGYSIFDGNFKEYLLQMPESATARLDVAIEDDEIQAAMDSDIAAGLTFMADSLEELAELSGIDAAGLIAQTERWNSYCETGVDEEYNLPAEKLFPIDTPPFYASRIRSAVGVVIYGLNVNTNSQVCDEDDVPIEGLYAIGNVQGNFFTDSYPILIPGISHGRCVTFGRILGQALANGTTITG